MATSNGGKNAPEDISKFDSKPPQVEGEDVENMDVGEVYTQPTAAEEKALLRKIDWR